MTDPWEVSLGLGGVMHAKVRNTVLGNGAENCVGLKTGYVYTWFSRRKG